MKIINRRKFFTRSVLIGGSLAVCNLTLAEKLYKTAQQTQGPFYPDILPLDKDNDLIVVNENITPAIGDVINLHGTVYDQKLRPVKNAVIEIWQVDSNGAYLHTQSANRMNRDRNFQGYGKFTTASDGRYRFRTIKPVPYPMRAPHIHVAVNLKGRLVLTTQCYVKGEPLNQYDRILKSIVNISQRNNVIVDFVKQDNSMIEELNGEFNIYL
ncbi:protocatechuate 3,4-dioxygenase [Marinicella meishanensis]|uniref:dioxygenase family protein n=1 Tax=Marinicella meishanensis TaxID=2873263 RepID=UPI001CBAF552|nr:protocatechuate 3,4-dioxygenase [Marinicella sp. NBU2979]